jgi:hypothetical protein
MYLPVNLIIAIKKDFCVEKTTYKKISIPVLDVHTLKTHGNVLACLKIHETQFTVSLKQLKILPIKTKIECFN